MEGLLDSSFKAIQQNSDIKISYVQSHPTCLSLHVIFSEATQYSTQYNLPVSLELPVCHHVSLLTRGKLLLETGADTSRQKHSYKVCISSVCLPKPLRKFSVKSLDNVSVTQMTRSVNV